MYELAHQMGLGVVATNNVHYHDRSEADLSEVLAAIGGRRSLDVADGFRPATDERFLSHLTTWTALCARSRGGETAAELGESLAFDLRLVAPRLPDFPMPGHFRSEMEYLRHLVFEGARDVYPDGAGGIEPGRPPVSNMSSRSSTSSGFPAISSWCGTWFEFARSPRHLLPDPGLGGRFGGVSLHRPHPGRPDPASLAVRTLPFRRTGPSARHRCRLRSRTSRGGDPVLLPALRAGSGRHGGQRHHLPGPLGAAGCRQSPSGSPRPR